MGDGAHLNAAARAPLALPPPARSAHIRRPRWIGYPRAQPLLAQLDDRCPHPKPHRLPHWRIVGDTHAGEPMLAKRFVQGPPANDHPAGAAALVPVLAVQAPPEPDENRFYNTMLEALGAPYTPRARVAQKQVQVLRLRKQSGLRMLSIDEVHHVLRGPVTTPRQCLHVLKSLGHDLPSPRVGVGIKEALRARHAASQLANRFAPAALPRWRLHQACQRLRASFARAWPLRAASRLADAPLARKRLAWSEGSLGALSALLTAAAVYAVTSGAERLAAQVRAAIAGVPPSERRRQAARLVCAWLGGAAVAQPRAALRGRTLVRLARTEQPCLRHRRTTLLHERLAPHRLLASCYGHRALCGRSGDPARQNRDALGPGLGDHGGGGSGAVRPGSCPGRGTGARRGACASEYATVGARARGYQTVRGVSRAMPRPTFGASGASPS